MNFIRRAQTNAQRLAILLPTCLIGAYLLGLLQPYIPQDKSLIPAGVMAVLAAPITIAVSLLGKLADVKKLKSYSRAEQRRLKPKIDRKVSAIQKLIVFYILLSVTVGFGLFFTTIDAGAAYAIWIYRFSGAAFTFTVLSSWMLLVEQQRTADFEAMVISRSQQRKQKAALLKRLKSD